MFYESRNIVLTLINAFCKGSRKIVPRLYWRLPEQGDANELDAFEKGQLVTLNEVCRSKVTRQLNCTIFFTRQGGHYT